MTVALFGISAVFYTANWISIDHGKGMNPMCLVIGIMCSGAGLYSLARDFKRKF